MQETRGGYPELRAALDFLEPPIQPAWLIPQFRHNLDGERNTNMLREKASITFPCIRNSIRALIGKQADALARKFAATHDMKVKEEIERLLKEYGKLEQLWVIRA